MPPFGYVMVIFDGTDVEAVCSTVDSRTAFRTPEVRSSSAALFLRVLVSFAVLMFAGTSATSCLEATAGSYLWEC